MDMKKMMKQAQKMQRDAAAAQQEIAAMTFEASAGGGMVKATATGEMAITDITIDPAAVDPEDVEMLQDMVVAAVNEALRLADAIREVKAGVHFCARCFNYAEGDLCEICASSKRDGAVICVVSEPRDIPPIERTAVFNGVYHVLGGVLAPMEGVGPGDLRIAELMARLGREDVTEVVLAMNPNIEGETTAAYLARLIKPLGVKVTRPASGLPVGGDLEFADEVTLGRALESRLPL